MGLFSRKGKVQTNIVYKANPMDGAIVLLDMNITNISIVNNLKEKLPQETICYINDLEYGEYEGHEPADIRSRIKKIIEFIKNKNPKLLYVINSVYIEYGEEFFTDLPFPVLNIVTDLVNYVNVNYPNKDLAFLANDGIIEANLYQKSIHYNRLYNARCNALIDCVNNKMMKTKESFNAVKDVYLTLQKKEFSIIVTPEINLLLLYTEFGEYVKDVELVRTDNAVIESISNELEFRRLLNKDNKDGSTGVDLYLYLNANQFQDENAFRKLLDSSIVIKTENYSLKENK